MLKLPDITSSPPPITPNWTETVSKLPSDQKVEMLSHLFKMHISQTNPQEFHNESLSKRTEQAITVIQTLEGKSSRQAFLEISLLDALWEESPSPQSASPSFSTGSHDPENWHQDSIYGEATDWELQQKQYDSWYGSMISHTSYIMNYFASGKNGMTLQDLPVMGLLHFITLERGIIADQLKHTYNPDIKFGTWRTDSVRTGIPLNNRYTPYFYKWKDLFSQENRKPQLDLWDDWRECVNPQPSSEALKTLVNERLSSIADFSDWGPQAHYELTHGPALFIHENRHAICKFLHETVCKALTPNITRENLYASLASLHWWLAQFTLFERGSASITEIFIQATAIQQGYPSPRWAPGILPDLEAIPRDEEDFVKIYPDLLVLEHTNI